MIGFLGVHPSVALLQTFAKPTQVRDFSVNHLQQQGCNTAAREGREKGKEREGEVM